jgi:hypothetical protein
MSNDKKTYCDPEELGSFITEDEDGTTREATPEEVEVILEAWSSYESVKNSDNI